MIKQIKSDPKYKKLVSDSKALNEKLRSLNIGELNEMLSLRTRYESLFKHKDKIFTDIRLKQKALGESADILMVATAYYERLIEMRNQAGFLRKEYEIILKKIRSLIFDGEGIYGLKKQDRDAYVEHLTIRPSLGIKKLEQSISVLDRTIQYMDKLQFNIKSAISIFKERSDYKPYED